MLQNRDPAEDPNHPVDTGSWEHRQWRWLPLDDGVTLRYTVAGDPSGAPVLLAHALGNTGATWDRLAAALCARGRRVIVPDQRGHGGSSQPGDYSFGALYADLTALLDTAAPRGADLVGHSMGGHVCWLIAQRQPDRVRRLVIEDTPPPPKDTAAERALRTGRRHSANLLGVVREFGALRDSGQLDGGAVRPIIDELRYADPGWWRALSRVTAETLVVSGGLDSPVPRALLAEVAERVPCARLLAIDAGHYVHERRPELFDPAVLAFLTTPTPRTAPRS
ncbi:alpha/beta hydrolase [Streptomyces sp. AJS327]|uniref:alpha/beta fold hydrolase n=1 Tax=Streptomyces sp. AJS327 TaxID=2545265 RepID=UPI0015DFD77B|nr:alpha/beta hydrolase [Streptomyces sp. AJS327]MBA0052921.1 alpha/beta hydrolase [Streptomyces sp. AJS327]